jgi:hypothetical protein
MYRSILVSATLEGVPLNQGPVEILAEPQGAAIQPSVHLLDLRAEKTFLLGNAGRLDLLFDVFNSLNANTATEIASRRGAFGAIFEVLPPRVARIGVRYRFGRTSRIYDAERNFEGCPELGVDSTGFNVPRFMRIAVMSAWNV